jgi:hypothetical protein
MSNRVLHRTRRPRCSAATFEVPWGRTATLGRCRALLAVPPPTLPRSESVAALVHRLTGVDITHCPRCRAGRLRLLATFRPGVRPVPVLDSS